jgi:hypothetical protein
MHEIDDIEALRTELECLRAAAKAVLERYENRSTLAEAMNELARVVASSPKDSS